MQWMIKQNIFKAYKILNRILRLNRKLKNNKKQVKIIFIKEQILTGQKLIIKEKKKIRNNLTLNNKTFLKTQW